MRTIYVIGAHCTGKTTLIEALGARLRHTVPDVSFGCIRETARSVLQLHQFTRDDVRAGGQRCLQLQRLILESQLESERGCEGVDLVLSDRSGLDPLVYARMYCGEEAAEGLSQGPAWTELRSSMRDGLVVVCEPVVGWLFDDGVRLMPKDEEEWFAMHGLFCETLGQQCIPYVVLVASVTSIDERVGFVLSAAGIITDTEVDAKKPTGVSC